MLFRKLDKRPGGSQIAGIIRFEPDYPNNV
jgi:hypothetical protein